MKKGIIKVVKHENDYHMVPRLKRCRSSYEQQKMLNKNKRIYYR